MNLHKLSKETGIDYNTLRYRVNVMGLSIKDATYKGNYHACFYINGISAHKLLNKYQYDMFIKRINKGMSSEEAYQDVLKCTGRKQKWNRTKYWIDGIPLSEYCRRNNLSYQGILCKLKTKSIKEAIDDYK